MVASRQAEIPFHRGTGRYCMPGFGAIAQVFVRTAFSFLRKSIVPVAKLVSADLLEFDLPEVADVVSGKKKFQNNCKECVKTNSENTIE